MNVSSPLGISSFAQTKRGDRLSALDDDFETGPSIITERGWLLYKPNAYNDEISQVSNGRFRYTTLAGGQSTRETGATSFWHDNFDGCHVYKPIAGNCEMSIRVVYRNLAATGLPPETSYRFGGILARDPSTVGTLNDVHLGGLVTNANYSVANSSTEDGVTTFPNVDITPGDPARVDLRITRVGSSYVGAYRNNPSVPLLSETGWISFEPWDRPDLPETLNWGLYIHALVSNHNILMDVEECRFRSP